MGLAADGVGVGRSAWHALGLQWHRRVAVLVGGMIGGAARIGLSAAFNQGGGLPWGTFVANVTGAALLGWLVTRVLQAGRATSIVVPLLATGVLGSYTTFSALSLEVWQLLQAQRAGLAAAYAGASLVVGVAGAAAGMHVARRRE